jgi:uncharacterized iron-regulated membrane protein
MTTLLSDESRLRRVLRLAHLWMGVSLLIPLVAIGVSGSVLVFNHEIAAVTNPQGYTATGEGDLRPLGEILATALPFAPDGSAPTMIVIPEERGEPSIVRFQRRGVQGPDGIHQVLLDPATLQVFGDAPFANDGFMRVMHRLHGNLLITGGNGRDSVGWLGVVMLALGISGLIMWWPKPKTWRAAFTVARGVKGHRLQHEIHGAIGIWSWLVFIVVSFSGVYIAFPQATGDLIRVFFPARDMRVNLNAAQVQPIPGTHPIGLDEAAQLALASAPDTCIWTARFPARPDQPYRFGLIRAGHEHGQPAVTVAIDPWNSMAFDLQDPKDFTFGETIMAWQRGLHAGEGLGWIWKILVALSGLLPIAFGLTGCAMWLMRRRARRRTAHQTLTQQARS